MCFHCGAPNPHAGALARRARRRASATSAARDALASRRRSTRAGLEAFYDRRTGLPTAGVDATRGGRPLDAVRRSGGAGRVRALDAGRPTRSVAAARRHPLRRLHLADRALARAQPGDLRRRGQFRDAARARGRSTRASASLSDLLRAIAADRLSRVPVRSRRGARRSRGAKRARCCCGPPIALLAMMQVMMFAVPAYVTVDGVAPEHRLLLDWASLTLTLPALAVSARRRSSAARGATCACGRLGMDVPVALGLGGAFAASAWVDAHRRRRRLLRLGDDVHRAAAGRALCRAASRGDARATRRGRRARAARRPPSGFRSTRLARQRNGRRRARLVAGRYRARARRRDGSCRRRSRRRPRERRGGDAHRRIAAARRKAAGDPVLAGSDRSRRVRWSCASPPPARRHALAAIERLVERAAAERPRVARVADRVAAWFVAALLALAAADGARLVAASIRRARSR